MANYTQLIKTINDNIKANGNQEITGPVLNAVLQAIVSGLSEGALFVGIANTTTNPPAYDGDVFYIALEPGTYSNFGVTVPNGSIGIIYNTSSDWAVTLINTYYEIDVDTLMQDSPSSEDINEAIGSFTYLKRAITVGVPFFGKGASGGNSTVAIAQVKQLSDIEVRVVMLNTGTVDGSNELVPIIKKITNSAGQLSLSTEAPTSFIGPLSSLNTNKKGSVVEAINEVNTGLKSVVKPYVVDLTSLLAAQDSESISTAIGGIDNLNGTVQKNQVIFGTLANGTVAVGIRVLGNQTTLTYFVDSVVGLTVNEIIITNTSGTLTKTANTHAVITENMVIDNLNSDETTLPLSAAQGKVLSETIAELSNADSTIDADILQLYLLEMQERNSYLNHTADISYKDGYFIYQNNGNEVEYASISIATVRNIAKYRVLTIENFLTANSGDNVGILFYDDNDNIISHFSAEAQDLNNFEGLIPEKTSYIRFNVRIAYKDRVVVRTDNLDESDGLHVKIEEVDGLPGRLDELSEGKISSIKDTLVTSSNLMNPDEIHKNQYDNGNFPHDSTSYNYAKIDVSDYPVGTKFYLMRKPNEKISMRYAGFYPKPDGTLFAENQQMIEKTEETQSLLSVSFSSYYDISELGVFVNVEDSDDFVFEDYYSEVQAEAQWERDAKNDNILVKRKELNTLRNEFSGNNILSGKKWAVIGDSFSADGTFSDIEESQKIQDGPMRGKVPTYKNLIANRNNMTIQDMTAGGRTMATPADGSFTNAFSNENNVAVNSNYKQIDSNVDYITIYLGINDSHHAGHGDDGEETQGEIPVGTIDDVTVNTFYGAWNVVLKYIRENHPFAKVGIIVSNGCGVDSYRQAEIELCKKWGFPYIDMNGDERTPAMIRSTSPDVSQEVKNIILEKQKISATNQHPNLQAQAFESTFIENFLRSL